MRDKQLDKIERKLRSVIRSCKTEDQVLTAEVWAYKIYFNLSTKLNLMQLLSVDVWIKYAVRDQKEYLEKLNEEK